MPIIKSKIGQLIVALDVDNIAKAKRLVNLLYPDVKIFKIGLELFTKYGPEAVKFINKKGAKVFLDLKFLDIPNTVSNAIKSSAALGVYMVNIHAQGGVEMMHAARSAKKGKYPILLAVTILTSQKKTKNTAREVLALAKQARKSGLDGVVCSAQEAKAVRKMAGGNFVIVTPGIRPQGSTKGDQKRVMTPKQAIVNGADYIVVGRPITESNNPLKVAREILNNI